jgi:hypothetical protein
VSIYDEPVPWISPRRKRIRLTTRIVLTSLGAVVLIGGSFLVVRAVTEAALGQCAPSWLTGTDPQLCLYTSVDHQQLNVSGTTSLPDGAVLGISAEDGPTFAQHWQTEVVKVPVSSGAFAYKFDLTGWGAGTVTTTVEFRMGPDQPQAVVDRYGAHGDNIVGPDVSLDFQAGDPPRHMIQVSVDTDLSAG